MLTAHNKRNRERAKVESMATRLLAALFETYFNVGDPVKLTWSSDGHSNTGVCVSSQPLVIRVDGEPEDEDGYEFEPDAGGLWHEVNNHGDPVRITPINPSVA